MKEEKVIVNILHKHLSSVVSDAENGLDAAHYEFAQEIVKLFAIHCVIVRCCSDINEIDNTKLPLKKGKHYRVHDEDAENYWIEDENGIIEHYYKDLFNAL
jgi:hypothetical protein